MAANDSELRQRKKQHKSPKKSDSPVPGSPKKAHIHNGFESGKDGANGKHEQLQNKEQMSPKKALKANETSKGDGKSRDRMACPVAGDVSRSRDFVLSIVLLIVALATRLHHLGLPRAVVFDELHFGKFAGFYRKQIFFFDSQPPLGKQLLAIAAYYADYDGEFSFERIGAEFPDSLPVWWLRAPAAFCGSLLVPAVYWLLRQLAVGRTAACVGGLLLILDNAMLTQSRLMLMEPFLLLFSVLGLTCVLRCCTAPSSPSVKSPSVKSPDASTCKVTVVWLCWLVLGFALLGAAVSVRYSGVLCLLLGWLVLARDFCSLVPDRRLTDRQLALQLVVRTAAAVVAPLVVYLTCFYVHLVVLYKAGAHDTIMTSAFQASLEGGLASVIANQPREVGHGSQVTLRHTLSARTCWLHSHEQLYPLKYDDDRGSSHQQQVSCYSFKDVNNWWIVKLPDTEDMRVTTPFRTVKDGDVVQLVHGMTSRALNSHDVAAPMSPGSQEVSCYIDYNISMPAQNLWRVQLVNPADTEGVWHAITSQVRFVHVNSGTALKYTGRQLPEWGMQQGEVVSDKVVPQDATVWNVEEHRYTVDEGSEKQQQKLAETEMLPVSGSVQLSFWRRFSELQLKMLFNNQETVQGHMYASEPTDWPLLRRGVAYWISPQSNAQLHFIGNVVVWLGASASLLALTAVSVALLLRRRRACYDMDEGEWSKLCTSTQFLIAGYLVNFLPYFVIDHTFFLHHYLPAYLFAVMSSACLLDHVHHWCRRMGSVFVWVLVHAATCCWLCACVYTFWRFSVVSYGTTALSAENVHALSWRSSWDLIVHKP